MSIIQDFLRYNRQMMLPEIGDSGQEKLKKAKTTGIYAVIGLILMMLSFSLVDVIINFIFKVT